MLLGAVQEVSRPACPSTSLYLFVDEALQPPTYIPPPHTHTHVYIYIHIYVYIYIYKLTVKSSLCFFNWASRHEGVLGSEGVAPLILWPRH
jgi:hypothetical protein